MNPQKKAGLFIVILIGVLMVLVIGLISGAAAYKAYDNHNSVDDFDQIQDSKLFLEFIEEKGRLKNVTVMFFKNSTKPTFMPPDSCGLYDQWHGSPTIYIREDCKTPKTLWHEYGHFIWHQILPDGHPKYPTCGHFKIPTRQT